MFESLQNIEFIINRRIRASEEEILGQNALISLKDAAESGLSSGTLAYFQMAIESKMSILVTGDAEKTSFIVNILSNFVPKYRRSVTIVNSIRTLRSINAPKDTRFTYQRYDQSKIAKIIKESIDANPEHLIAYGLKGPEISELFVSHKWNIPFIAAMQIDSDQLISKLVAKRVSLGDARALDVSISAETLKISEYKWLSKAEIDLEGTQLSGVDAFVERNTNSLDRKWLEDSKVIRNYSKISGLSTEYSIRELEKRSLEIF